MGSPSCTTTCSACNEEHGNNYRLNATTATPPRASTTTRDRGALRRRRARSPTSSTHAPACRRVVRRRDTCILGPSTAHMPLMMAHPSPQRQHSLQDTMLVLRAWCIFRYGCTIVAYIICVICVILASWYYVLLVSLYLVLSVDS